MVTLERITSTGNVEQDAQAVADLNDASETNNLSIEEAEAREQKAREAALEPPRNALVEQPYREGETIDVVVHDDGSDDPAEEVTPQRRVVSSSDESVVDAQRASVRKTAEGTDTRQAISSPQPPVA